MFRYADAVHRHQRIPAFTIIEILIVIAIVGLLIAISLPGLGAARARAKEAHCVASIRNAHGLVGMYAADASDLPPHGGYQRGSLATGEPAVRVMYTSTGIEVPYFYQTWLWGTIAAFWQGEAIVGATCPSTDESRRVIHPPRDDIGDTGSFSSYCVSAAFFADPAFWQPTPAYRESEFAAQRSASQQLDFRAIKRCFMNTMWLMSKEIALRHCLTRANEARSHSLTDTHPRDHFGML